MTVETGYTWGMRMNLAKTQFRRLVDLERKIRGNEYPNCLTFAEHAEVTQKTAQRDIDYLRDQLQAPIEYDRKRKGYYYTEKNWFLPSVILHEGSLVALLIASRTLEQYKGSPIGKELEAIFRKIEDLLPEKVSIKPEMVYDKFTFVSPPSKPIEEKVWLNVVRGLLYQKALVIKYHRFDSQEIREYTIHPCHLANLQGEWYVFSMRDGLKQYSLARIKEVTLTDESFKPANLDPKLFSNAFGRFVSDELYDVKLRFDKEVSDWVTEKAWHSSQKITRRKNGDIELSFRTSGLYEVQRWVLSWGHVVKVLEPKELKLSIREEISMMKG